MSWNTLFEALDEEFNEKRHVKHSKRATLTFLDEIAHELTEDRLEEREALKKAGRAIKRGWMKLKNKIKEVARWGFRLGVAVGKTVAGKYVLFNRDGQILVPEAEKISYQPIVKGKSKKALTLEYNITKLKGNNIKIHMDDKLSFGFGTAIGPNSEGIMYVIEPQRAGLKEGIDYKRAELLAEGEKEDLAAIASAEAEIFDSFTGPGAKVLEKTEDEPPQIAPVDVNYDDFLDELGSLMDMVKEGEVLETGKIKNLAIYAPTGWGKSQIIEKLAKKKGYHYFPLELQKVDINIIQGFPYLDDAKEAPKAPDEVKEDRITRAKKIVRMAPSQFLPPSGDPGSWLLFFDEFNRADTEKMSAVMNLLMTGELGGAAELIASDDEEAKLDRYKLPEKVVVVLAMNTGTQAGIEDAMNAVKDLDIATLERVHRVLFGRYHAPSWFSNYANKPFIAKLKNGMELPMYSRIPAIIKNFIIDVMKKESGKGAKKAAEAPFLLPITVAQREGEEGGGGARTTSPRSWTMIADRMIEDGYQMFKTLSDEARAQYRDRAEKLMKEIKKREPDAPNNVEQYLFAAWMQDARNQIKLLGKQSPELGDEGVEYIGKMIRSYQKKAKEGLSDEDILFNYKAVRELVKNNFQNLGFGTHAKLLARLYHTLSKYQNEQEVEEFMEEKGFPILSKQGIVPQLQQTIQALYKDLDMSGADFTTFAHLLESGAKQNETELIRKLHRRMAGKWEEYVEALRSQVKTKSQVAKELEKLGGKASPGTAEEQEDGEEEKNEDLELFFRKIEGRL